MKRALAQSSLASLMGIAVVAGCTFNEAPTTGQAPESTRPESTSTEQGDSVPSSLGPDAELVTSKAQLIGHWRTVELYGTTVSRRRDLNGRRLHVGFSKLDGQWWWAANDGCNTTSGHLRVEPDGAFNADGGVSTLVGCVPMPIPGGNKNVKAVQEADQAWMVPGVGAVNDRLVLTSDDAVVGVYQEA